MYHFSGPHGQFTLTHADVALLALLVIWETAWKGVALWKAGHHRQLYWFIAMLIVNTAGILEIVYIAFFQTKTEYRSGTAKP